MMDSKETEGPQTVPPPLVAPPHLAPIAFWAHLTLYQYFHTVF